MKIIRHPCAIDGCPMLVTVKGHICADHEKQLHDEQISLLVEEFERTRKKLGLPETWGCLDPNCEICS